jgi:hypothetical protein
MKILAARKYKSLRQAPLSDAEAETRRLAYAIKDPASPSTDFDTAAREMARLIETPCWLIPIPASDGSTRANTILASLIASHRTGAQVAQAIRRTRPIESQCARHRRNLPPTAPDQHHLKATIWSLGSRQVYFVDNVATSGNTMRAAHAAMQRGAGLVFADAGGHTHTQGEPTLL